MVGTSMLDAGAGLLSGSEEVRDGMPPSGRLIRSPLIIARTILSCSLLLVSAIGLSSLFIDCIITIFGIGFQMHDHFMVFDRTVATLKLVKRASNPNLVTNEIIYFLQLYNNSGHGL